MVIIMQTYIYDCFDTDFKSPFGAIRQHQPCVFTLRFPTYMAVEYPTLVMFRPGYKEKFVQLEFKTCEKGVFNLYTCTYTPQDLGLHHYYFSVMQNGSRNCIKRKGASIGALDGNELFQLTVFDKNLKSADWLKGGIMYQIFPDRFAKSKSNFYDDTVSETDNENQIPIDRILHTNWEDTPEWRPNNHGKITNNDYFGGNLKGIEQKLPYLASLGVTCIYMNPIFESHENHRYNTADYEKVDPMLGNEDDFKNLCVEARKKGINIIIDGVFSHTGADSRYFNKFGRYGEKTGAYRDPNSPFKEWYSFSNYPYIYDSWWGFDTLPNVNENMPSYTEYICGNNGVLQKWIDLGAMGWRLDVADELPDEFIDNLNKAVKAKGDDKVIFGEVWEDASNKESYGVRRRYLIGGQLDSVMNYPFKEAILNYIKYSDADGFKAGIMTILEHYPKPSVDILMNFISTHDIERALTRLGGEAVGNHDRAWQAERVLSDAEYIYGIALLKCAMVLQFFLPGIPCIYYGDEAGTEGYKDPFNRRTYPWGNEDLGLLEFVRELSKIRRSSRVFEKGVLDFYNVTPTLCSFTRTDEDINESVAVYLNKSKKSYKFKLIIPSDRVVKFEVIRPVGLEREPGIIHVAPYDYAVIKFELVPGSVPHKTNENHERKEDILIYE